MLLAIDTATDTSGVSLDDGDQVLAERIWRSARHHTSTLAPVVAVMMRDCGISAKDLSAVAVASGPGSYTGLRIGMALAKGLALAHHLPLIGVPTLDILARAQNQREEPMLAVIRAGRGRVAAVWYKWGRQGWQATSEPESLNWDQVLDRIEGPTFVCGEVEDGRKRLSKASHVHLAEPAECIRRPSFLGLLARERLDAGEVPAPAELVPTYLGDLSGG
ncbi:MAG: tRNA (adenosine(37)-N6)-threonylcarbamoyltransferase complex dimerization subunit type 1 TsaB [Anaerolineales bacterium]